MQKPIYSPFAGTVGQNQNADTPVPLIVQPLPPSDTELQTFLEAAQQASRNLTDSLTGIAHAYPAWGQLAPSPFPQPAQGASSADRLVALRQHLGQLTNTAQSFPPLLQETLAAKAPPWWFTFMVAYLLAGAVLTPIDLVELVNLRYATKKKRIALQAGLSVGVIILTYLGLDVFWKFFFGVSPAAEASILGAIFYAGVAALTQLFDDQDTARIVYFFVLVLSVTLLAMQMPSRGPGQALPGRQPRAPQAPTQPTAQVPSPQTVPPSMFVDREREAADWVQAGQALSAGPDRWGDRRAVDQVIQTGSWPSDYGPPSQELRLWKQARPFSSRPRTPVLTQLLLGTGGIAVAAMLGWGAWALLNKYGKGTGQRPTSRMWDPDQ